MATPGGLEGNASLHIPIPDPRLQQITEHIDRIERELSDVQELVAGMRDDTIVPELAQDMKGARDRSAPDRPARPVQEDSASL